MTVGADRLVDTSLLRDGVPGIALEGEKLRLTVFPEAGGKILDLVHKPTGVDLLWKNPRVPLRRTYPGAMFDDVWCGGWDELFPTDPPCELDGNAYHDHGDFWIGPWEWSIERDDGDEATLYLRRHAVSLPCLMERWVTLPRDGLNVSFRHRLTNLGTQTVPYVWSLHVAHAIAPDSRLHLPAGRLGVVWPQCGRAGDATGDISWPTSDGQDLAGVPRPESGLTEFFFARDLREGWCAVVHPSAGLGLGLSFDSDVFSTVWIFGVYGGWRGHYVLLTEPSTSPPGGLAKSVAEGQAAQLEPGAALETRVVATVLEGVDPGLSGDALPPELPAWGREER